MAVRRTRPLCIGSVAVGSKKVSDGAVLSADHERLRASVVPRHEERSRRCFFSAATPAEAVRERAPPITLHLFLLGRCPRACSRDTIPGTYPWVQSQGKSGDQISRVGLDHRDA